MTAPSILVLFVGSNDAAVLLWGLLDGGRRLIRILSEIATYLLDSPLDDGMYNMVRCRDFNVLL